MRLRRPGSPAPEPVAGCHRSGDCGQTLLGCVGASACSPTDAVRQASSLFPIVIATTRDQQRLTQPGDFVLAAHLFDSGIPLGGTSERMPSDFFKTSRCSKSLAFSARNRRISASSASTLRFDLDSFVECLDSRSKLRPAIEQRRTNTQFGRHLGRAASAVTP